jgi:manganese/zinc/iron transport system ATP- binding protein
MKENQEMALEVEALRVSYHEHLAVEDLSFGLRTGRLVGIVGPNGAGKSTLIKAIVGSLKADSGVVRVFGKTALQNRRRMTYVPQRGSVDWDFPVTVEDVVAQGRFGAMGLFGRFTPGERAKVREALERVGLQGLGHRQIGELSGGQQQRVFLARALAQDGELYLLDEPFAGVDAATESAIVEVLRGLKGQGKTVVVVHHDLSTLVEYFDDLLLLNRKLVAFGPTREVFVPELLQLAYGGKLAVFGDSSTTMLTA